MSAPSRTIPERVFDVRDSGGRVYHVTRYAWLDNVAADGAPEQWQESYHLLMTENGGYLEPLGEGRYRIDGTGTLVADVETA